MGYDSVCSGLWSTRKGRDSKNNFHNLTPLLLRNRTTCIHIEQEVFMKTEELLTIGDVAKRLDVPQYRIVYLLQRGRVPEPPRLSGRRIFTEQDMDHIANQLNQPHAGRPPRRKENDDK